MSPMTHGCLHPQRFSETLLVTRFCHRCKRRASLQCGRRIEYGDKQQDKRPGQHWLEMEQLVSMPRKGGYLLKR